MKNEFKFGWLAKLSGLVAALFLSALPAVAQMKGDIIQLNTPQSGERLPTLKGIGIDQHLDAQVPMDLQFRDEAGKSVRLSDYFGQRPEIGRAHV